MDELDSALANREERAKQHLDYVALALKWDRNTDFVTDEQEPKCVLVFSSAVRLTDYMKVLRKVDYQRSRCYWRVLLAEDELQDFRNGIEQWQGISHFVLDPPAFGEGDPRSLAELDAALVRIASDQPRR